MLEREAKKKYFIEMGAAMALYLVTLVVSIRFGRTLEPGAGRTLLLLTPVRQFGRMDEFVRLRSLEAFSVAGAITAGLTLTYAFLETAGFPKLSMFWVWPVMGFVWGLHSCLRMVIHK